MDNRDKQLALFRAPDAAYRGAPFWAWNTYMTEKLITRMLTAFKDMGMGGAHIHSRTGMAVPYLSDEFFRLIKFSRSESQRMGMLTYLYDEDRWASGFGGGFVTSNHDYRLRFLVFSPISPDVFPKNAHDTEKAVFSGERKELGCYGIRLENGFLKSYRLLSHDEMPDENEKKWYAWLEVSGDQAWYNEQSYVDALNPDAVRKFIEVTHEAYFCEVGDGFGKDIPSIFTDEPQFSSMTTFAYPEEQNFHTMPYTERFEDAFKEAYGESFLEHLPEIFFLRENGRMSVRSYRYHDLMCEMFVSSYCDQIGKWCKEHNIAFTGHIFREDFLEGQTYAVGEVMRCYRAFQIPGIDVLSDNRRITTAKQVQSAAHQFGRNRITSEMYGVTNWNFDFRGHKLQGDWQAALGITNRVHHVAWTTMKGDAKRDYPASIGPQSPWYKRYSMVEDYFARLNTVLTRGKPAVRIGVIHPIETYWLYWGPNSQTAEIRDEMDERFVRLTSGLLYATLDYDYISEGLLRDMPEQQAHDKFDVGEMSYDVVVVPACQTLRSTTLDRLQKYAQAGGKIIFIERKPFLVDGQDDNRPSQLPGNVVPFSINAICTALEPWRTVSVLDANFMRSKNLFSQWRRDDECNWLFLAHVEHPVNCDIPTEENYNISIAGHWQVEKWDALSGETSAVSTTYTEDKTCWQIKCYAYDSMLYRLTPGKRILTGIRQNDAPAKTISVSIPERAAYTLSEPNVFIIDHAEYRFDDDTDWQAEEEMLRINRKAKDHWHIKSDIGQPWLYNIEKPQHVLHLRCKIPSSIRFNARLALENAAACSIKWNNEAVSNKREGYYVDPAIECIAAPLHGLVGENILEIDMPFGLLERVENMFLLGDFGVRLLGRSAQIVPLPETVSFTNLAAQDLSFYSGNIELHIPLETENDGDLDISTTFFRCPAIDVLLDNRYYGTIAFAPYTCRLNNISAGKHTLTLLCYGNRMNTFGALHLSDRKISWKGDNMWHTTGAAWSYEYQLSEFGLMKSPEISFSTGK